MEKQMKFLKANSIYKLVEGANEIKLTKEDVVELVQLPDCYILIYFG